MHLPPILAASLCFAFILWLLRRDAKRASGVSAALWIPLIWVWIIASKPLAYWFASGTAASEVVDVNQGSFFDRNAYLVLIFLGLIVLVKRGVTWNQVFVQNRWLWIFSLFCLISVMWSPIPFVAFKRWIKDVGTIVMILVLLTEQNPTVAIRTLFLRCAYLLVPLSVLFIKYYPEMGKYYNQWTGAACYGGVTTNKNSLGVLAMISGLCLLWSIVDIEKRSTWLKTARSTWPELAVLLMCVWILKIADSATSLACFIVGTAVFLAIHLNWVITNLRRLGWCMCGLVLASFLFFAIPDLRKVVAESLGRDVNLTTRTDIWDAALDLKTNPLIGAGFASVWLTRDGAALVKEMGGLAHSHNGYLETYLNTGLVGVALLLAVMFTAGRNTIRELSSGAVVGNLFAALFLCGVIYNYTEVTFNKDNIVGFSLWLMATQLRLPCHLEITGTDAAFEASAWNVNLSGIESVKSSQSQERWAIMRTEDTHVPHA